MIRSIKSRLLKLESSVPKNITYYNHDGKLCRLNYVRFLLAAMVFDILEKKKLENREVTGLLVDEKVIYDDIPVSEYAKIADQLDAILIGNNRSTFLINIVEELRARVKSQ